MKSHIVSNKSIAAAKRHVEQIEKHGRTVEQLGAALSRFEQFTEAEIEFIQLAGQLIQAHAQVAAQLIEVAQYEPELSTLAYVIVGQHHSKAVKLHVRINKIFLKAD